MLLLVFPCFFVDFNYLISIKAASRVFDYLMEISRVACRRVVFIVGKE